MYPGKMIVRWIDELIYLSRDTKVSSETIMSDMGLSQATFMKVIAMFKNKGWVEYKGIPKNGYYVMTEKGFEFLGKEM